MFKPYIVPHPVYKVNSAITDEQVQEIANILAANVDTACDFNVDGTVAIVPENFNDAFFDMEETYS